MKRLCYALVLFLVFSGLQSLRAVTRDDFLKLSFNGLPYRLFIPEDYRTSLNYPLVLFLHGGGASGTNNESQLDEWAMLFAQDSIQQKHPSFVLVPQTNSGWANGDREIRIQCIQLWGTPFQLF